jgi:hypothetical protein
LWLERDFEESEVLEVVKELQGDKSPSPDGFSLGFVQTCWEVIKEDIMAVFRDFHSKGRFHKCLNATFIALIQKKKKKKKKKRGRGVKKDFRRISLVGNVYDFQSASESLEKCVIEDYIEVSKCVYQGATEFRFGYDN